MNNESIGTKIVKWLKWFFFSYIWLGVLFFVIDLVTKLAIVNHFKTPDADPVVLIPGFLRISYVVNTHAAMGLGFDQPLVNRIVYCIVAFIGLGLILGFYIWKFKKINALTKACLMLMAVGALGNLIDRLFYTPSFLGYEFNGVVDWIDFYFNYDIWRFVFNIADSCVVVGTIILIVYLIVDEIKDFRKRRKEEVKNSQGKVLSKEEQARLEEEKKEETLKAEENKAEIKED